MPKSVEFFLSKGFDLKMAEYYARGRKKIVSARVYGNYKLLLEYERSDLRIYDVKPLIKKNTVFEKLLNPEIFASVFIDDTNSICWKIDSKIMDISPDTAYIESVPFEESSENS